MFYQRQSTTNSFQQHIICCTLWWLCRVLSIGFIRLFIFRFERHIDRNVLAGKHTVHQENDVISFNYVLKGAFIQGKVNTTTNENVYSQNEKQLLTMTDDDVYVCMCYTLVVDTRHDYMLLFSLFVIVCVCVCVCSFFAALTHSHSLFARLIFENGKWYLNEKQLK